MTEIQLPSQQQRQTEISQATAVEQARAVAEVAAAVRVAQQFPRDEERAYAAMRRACQSRRLAERAFYAVQNRGNGPSVHLARELARIWGNNDYGVRELRRDGDDTPNGKSEILAYAWDQETNMRSSRSFIQPHQRMANKQRKALTDLQDIYLNNQNIGARAVRECIFSVLPSDFVEEAQELCHQTLTQASQATGVPVEQQRREAVAAFTRAGVTVGQLEKRFGPVDSWTPEILASTHVLWTSLQRNELTLAEAFEPAEPGAAGGRVTVDEITTQQTQRRTADPGRNERLAGKMADAGMTASDVTPAPQTGDAGGLPTSGTPAEERPSPPADTPASPPTQDPAPVAPQESPQLNAQGPLARRMFALFRDAGVSERSDRLAYAADVLQRQISTSTDLTEADAHKVIAALEADVAAQQEATGADRSDPDLGGESDGAGYDPTSEPDWGQRG